MAGTGEFDYEVDSLLDKRIGDGSQVEYLVHWKGFTADWDTWEPADNLQNCKQKIIKFEKQRKKSAANTQKIVKKLVNKSKMARQDQSFVNSAKNIKQLKKEMKLNSEKKKKTAKPNKNVAIYSIDNVLEAVVNGTSTNPKSKKKKDSVTPKKIVVKVTPLKIKIKREHVVTPTPKKKITLSSPQQKKKLQSSLKLSASVSKKGNKNSLQGKRRKSEGDVLPNKKEGDEVMNAKNWTAVDEEISFSSDDEPVEKLKVKKVKDSMKQNKKVNGIKVKQKSGTLNDKSKSKEKKESLKNIKLLNSSQKSAFRPVSKKKQEMKLSVSHLIGSKKKAESSGKHEDSTKTVETQKKKDNSTIPKKRKSENLDLTIETDSDSDAEILYSLSDTSDLAINDPDSSHYLSNTMPGVDSARSKSESSVDKRKPSQKGKKNMVKKSKSTSEASPGKKIKLLDSLKQASPEKLGSVLQSSQPLLAQPQWVIDDDITPGTAQSASLPISPASMSYKVLLENLPHQLHPKNKKKATTETVASDIERRVSVRASECAFKYKEIVIKKCQKYTQIWLNTHTKMKNALNPLVMQEISMALNAAKYDDSNLVMFSGLCNVFCSGVDLHYLTVGDKKIAARQMADSLRDLVRKFITFPKLIVAVVTGPAIGLGSALLPLCDIVYASDKATFYMPYAQLSQTPEGCASFTLPNIVGIAMANEMLVGGRKITAIEACQLGFVSQVYWPTSMMQEVIPRVQHMALVSGKVLETTKLLVRSHQRTKLDLTNESECNLLVERWPSPECQRAIEEFISNDKNYIL
ncbi:testis-specific chromodomain protein Y 2-like isoform X2 [Ruditapes philippinarum]|uniref:testis-specific chromodomain protein Y 2-like isoform X2 n=1 Tax=Ruditapes philippinarum TaxID=129788 RepID=UPI00295AA72E|nr:testis-specific chromodomain protein Y 2-like isoform X2 [Ruditapes philippinarum]